MAQNFSACGARVLKEKSTSVSGIAKAVPLRELVNFVWHGQEARHLGLSQGIETPVPRDAGVTVKGGMIR